MRQIDFSKELITKLFTIAIAHTKPKQTRVDEMVPLLLSVEVEKFRQDELMWRNTDPNWHEFKPQVLKNREAEQAFFVAFIQEIFKKYEEQILRACLEASGRGYGDQIGEAAFMELPQRHFR